MTEPGQTQPLPEAGAACGGCGAALAADQRYCLNCGERRGPPRVEYRDRLGPGQVGAPSPNGSDGRPLGAEAAPPPAPAVAPARGERRDYAPLAAAGGIAVLGIMLLIGVLIGRGTGSTGSEGQVPQVVTVESSGSGTAGGTAGGRGGEGGGNGGKTASKGGGKSSGAGGKTASPSASGTGSAPVASDQELQNLQEQSPEEYQESSAKLPDEIATPGAAPPTDGKEPGGGSGGATIE